jgi:Mg-chelatase subunit ChlD
MDLMARLLNEKRYTLRGLPFLVIALLLGTTACKDNSFRGATTRETPNTDESIQQNPPTNTGSSEQERASPVPEASATSVISEIQSAKVVKEEGTRQSFIDALIAAGIAAGSQIGQSEASEPQQPVKKPPQCVSSSSSSGSRALDVVFNIDVSTSMNPYIDVVRENVIAFSEALSGMGTDARIGAVGFVNAPLQSIDLTSSSAFRSAFSGWRTIENGNFDMQEGGQSSLEHALWMLSASEVGARAGAAKVIIHISDAVAFAGENHEDFSVTQLSAAFRAARNQFGSLLFFDSVPSSAGETGSPAAKKRLSFSPRMQMTDLRTQSQNLGGGPLQFPFSASAMTLELPQGIQSGISGLPTCN